jgi:hypothetical protein
LKDGLINIIRSPFVPEGDLPEEVFQSEMVKQGLKSRDIDAAKEIVDNITKETDKNFSFYTNSFR